MWDQLLLKVMSFFYGFSYKKKCIDPNIVIKSNNKLWIPEWTTWTAFSDNFFKDAEENISHIGMVLKTDADNTIDWTYEQQKISKENKLESQSYLKSERGNCNFWDTLWGKIAWKI